MQTEMMMEVANASKLYFVQKDYDLTFKNTKNPAAAIDVISFAQKIKKGVKKYVNDDKKKFVVNIFDELYKELDDYTLDKIITNKDELVASKESLRVINESQQLSGVNEEIGNLKKKMLILILFVLNMACTVLKTGKKLLQPCQKTNLKIRSEDLLLFIMLLKKQSIYLAL
jgi:hypothetical protein